MSTLRRVFTEDGKTIEFYPEYKQIVAVGVWKYLDIYSRIKELFLEDNVILTNVNFPFTYIGADGIAILEEDWTLFLEGEQYQGASVVVLMSKNK